MDLDSGVSLGTLAFTLFGLLVTGGIAWGSLLQRVKTLEKEVEALSGFEGRLIRIEERTNSIKTGIEQITGSWLFKEPPPPRPTRRPGA